MPKQTTGGIRANNYTTGVSFARQAPSNVEPYSIVAGNPAVAIRKRFTERQIRALMRIQWWEWPADRVIRALPYMLSSDIDSFIAYARRHKK
jgi:hypothetical protein